MNSQEAKFILQAYRHHGEDAQDPRFAEALAQAGRDPDLAHWLAEDQRLHRLMSDGLKGVPVPAHLKDSILAGGKVVHPPHRWQPARWWAAAAALFLLAVAGGLWSWQHARPAGDLAAFRTEMSQFLTTQLTYLDHQSEQPEAILRWLAQYDAPANFALPESLSKLPGIGCRILHWHGRTVSMICFRVRNGGEVHLFVIDSPDWHDLPPKNQPNLAASGLWMTAAWTQGDQAFLLAGKGTAEELNGYVNP